MYKVTTVLLSGFYDKLTWKILKEKMTNAKLVFPEESLCPCTIQKTPEKVD